MNEAGLPGIPKHWVRTNLEDCVKILDSKRIPINAEDRETRQGNIPYYGATGQVGWIDDFIFDDELVLLGEDGAPFLDPFKPKAYVIKGKSWVNNHAHVLKAISNITLNSLLCSYLNTFDYHGYVTGTTRLKLNQAPMRGIPLPLPPLPEQHRIVAKIEELFTKLDGGVEALKKVKAQLKRYRQAVLKYAFEGKLTQEWREANKDKLERASVLLERIKDERKKIAGGKIKELTPLDTSDLVELPGSWEWVLLPTLGELNRGKSKHRPRDDQRLFGGKYPFIQTGDVKNSKGLIKGYIQTYNDFGLKQSRLWPINTLCITIAANIAETALLGIESCFPDSVVGFIADEKICNVKYVHFFFKTIREKLESFAPATAQKNINLNTLSNVVIPLSSRAEQDRIIEEIESRFSMADEVEKVAEQTLKQSERLRQSILKTAFEGKLVPQDPTDEPAEKLLQRIKAEKAKRESETKGRRKKPNQMERI